MTTGFMAMQMMRPLFAGAITAAAQYSREQRITSMKKKIFAMDVPDGLRGMSSKY